jgi:16S rRNA (cytidine1402-2'-O)-methyltransferase
MNQQTASVKGRLFLVPAPLDFGCSTQTPLESVIPQRTLETAAQLNHWICENAKSARAYLKRIGEIHPLSNAIQALQLQELPRHVHKKGDHGIGQFDARPLLTPALSGHDIGLISEAGMPAVADPGSSVVRAAHDLGLKVIALSGPVSLLLALAASGLNGQNFAFVGYLPQDGGERTHRIRELESLSLKTGQTQIFIETPYRNQALWQSLLQCLHPNTRLAISQGISLQQECHRSELVKGWRQASSTPGTAFLPPNDIPAVFAIGR